MNATAEKFDKVFRMTDCLMCFASKARGTMIDTIHPATGLSWCYGKSLSKVREEYPDAEEMTVDAFCEWKATQQRTPITWEPTTAERFDESLCVLPPEIMLRGGFLVGEPWDHDAGNGQPRFQAFIQTESPTEGTRYFQSNRPCTVAEFKAELKGLGI